MNKTQLVDTVRSGEPVSITGFGVFESRARGARVARNPRTGEIVDVPATMVPAFRPGAAFRTAVGGGAASVRRVDAAGVASEVLDRPVTNGRAVSDGSFATIPEERGKPAKGKAKAGKGGGKGKKAKSKKDKVKK